MTTNNKENAYGDFIKMIRHSWTWAKLTEEERQTFIDECDFWNHETIVGTYRQRLKTLNGLYSMFLNGLGYRRGNFRSEEDEPAF